MTQRTLSILTEKCIDSLIEERTEERIDNLRKEEYKIFPDFIPWIGVLMHGAREYTKYGMGCSSQEFILDSLNFKNPKRSLFLAYHLVFTSLLVFLPVIYDSYRILRDYR